MCENCGALKQRADFSALDPVLDGYVGVRGSLITILQKAQDIYGYLAEETIDYIALRTGTKPAKIFGVATFYAQFRLNPIGKNLIMLCKGTACHVNGADDIEESVIDLLGVRDGETTEDGVFTLNNVACLGCCSLAPVMMIRGTDGEETFGNLTKDKVRAILNDIRARETAVAV
ncbi:MAG: NAD(P)H-dependent oxidoreductase subunit E [Oscillospiraceae bacterium]|jgi:NADH-quinone oxidoreductase subunit E|nr:NAD(P)H-dependent oxidoreductase subunit E [Oscillospiraceae bacterium]